MSDRRGRWRERLDDLIGTVTGWVETQEWVTKRYPKKMRGDDGTVYEVPSLYLQRGPTRLFLDPIADDAPGTEGVVDLYLMPTYDDMAGLYLVDGRWQIHYMFPGDPPVAATREPQVLDLSEATINRVLDEIATHAVPSF